MGTSDPRVDRSGIVVRDTGPILRLWEARALSRRIDFRSRRLKVSRSRLLVDAK